MAVRTVNTTIGIGGIESLKPRSFPEMTVAAITTDPIAVARRMDFSASLLVIVKRQ